MSAIVLGVAQDAGFPHIGCTAPPCAKLRAAGRRERVACLGLVDGASRFMIDATPDLPSQLDTISHAEEGKLTPLSGILLTHAHIGHYTGLMYLGREGMNAKGTPVYCTTVMANFLRTNAPWSQLVNLKNIVLVEITPEKPFSLTPNLSVTAMLLPHRNEFADTVGYAVKGPRASILYIPDIDSWEAWSVPLERAVQDVTYALLDGTFSSLDELPAAARRAEVPHPPVHVTISRLAENQSLASRVTFTHLNHTNPLLWDDDERRKVTNKGFRVAHDGLQFVL